MNKYETIFIINNSITEEKRNEVIQKFKDYISKNGNIIDVEDKGRKKLAYEIQKQKEGYYYLIKFETEPETVVELERRYRITDEVLKFLTLRLEDNYNE